MSDFTVTFGNPDLQKEYSHSLINADRLLTNITSTLSLLI